MEWRRLQGVLGGIKIAKKCKIGTRNWIFDSLHTWDTGAFGHVWLESRYMTLCSGQKEIKLFTSALLPFSFEKHGTTEGGWVPEVAPPTLLVAATSGTDTKGVYHLPGTCAEAPGVFSAAGLPRCLDALIRCDGRPASREESPSVRSSAESPPHAAGSS